MAQGLKSEGRVRRRACTQPTLASAASSVGWTPASSYRGVRHIATLTARTQMSIAGIANIPTSVAAATTITSADARRATPASGRIPPSANQPRRRRHRDGRRAGRRCRARRSRSAQVTERVGSRERLVVARRVDGQADHSARRGGDEQHRDEDRPARDDERGQLAGPPSAASSRDQASSEIGESRARRR